MSITDPSMTRGGKCLPGVQLRLRWGPQQRPCCLQDRAQFGNQAVAQADVGGQDIRAAYTL
eukprot:scaffold4590_cov389-Prasinococcus_capsulatus_cf.AAC.10